MKNNVRLYFRINTELYDRIKEEAKTKEISIAQLCRQKIIGSSQLTKIEMMLENLSKKLNSKGLK